MISSSSSLNAQEDWAFEETFDNLTTSSPSQDLLPKRFDYVATHRTHASTTDKSFYICNNHMMSSMGDVEGYSVSSFYPRQEFDFSAGGF